MSVQQFIETSYQQALDNPYVRQVLENPNVQQVLTNPNAKLLKNPLAYHILR